MDRIIQVIVEQFGTMCIYSRCDFLIVCYKNTYLNADECRTVRIDNKYFWNSYSLFVLRERHVHGGERLLREISASCSLILRTASPLIGAVGGARRLGRNFRQCFDASAPKSWCARVVVFQLLGCLVPELERRYDATRRL